MTTTTTGRAPAKRPPTLPAPITLALALALVLLALAPALAPAQQALSGVFRQPGTAAAAPGNGTTAFLLVRVVILVVAVLVAFFVSFRVIFPAKLERAEPLWPMDAYGLAWAWFSGLTGVALLALFLPEWVLTYWVPSLQRKIPDIVNHYVLKVAIVLLTLLAVIASRTIHHSEARAKYATAPAVEA